MIHILGAGIAGLALAEALARRGMPWRVYEKAESVGHEASGKNAGIVRTYEADAVLKEFAVLSFDYYVKHEPSFVPRGMLFRPWELDYSEEPDGQRLFQHGRFEGGFYPQNGTLEPRQLLARLAHGDIIYNAPITLKLDAEMKKIVALVAPSQEWAVESNDTVVVACGEGSIALSNQLECNLDLISYRRTLYEFENTIEYDGPVEWNEEAAVYFRPSSGAATLTATAGEQIPTNGDVAIDEEYETEKAFAIFSRELPFLTRSNLLGQRTCRRLTPLDNRPYVGSDPKYTRLFWFTGLGGRGISLAPALADTLAQTLSDETPAKKIFHFRLEGRVKAD